VSAMFQSVLPSSFCPCSVMWLRAVQWADCSTSIANAPGILRTDKPDFVFSKQWLDVFLISLLCSAVSWVETTINWQFSPSTGAA